MRAAARQNTVRLGTGDSSPLSSPKNLREPGGGETFIGKAKKAAIQKRRLEIQVSWQDGYTI